MDLLYISQASQSESHQPQELYEFKNLLIQSAMPNIFFKMINGSN